MANIQTTHTGSLPRSEEQTLLLIELEGGHIPAELARTTTDAVAEIVSTQYKLGVDIINDGEQGKTGYSTYVSDRLAGFEGVATARPPSNDLRGHEDFIELSVKLRGRSSAKLPPCSSPIRLINPEAVHIDIANLTAAADAAGVPRDHLFMSAASPGLIGMFFENQYYPNRAEYLHAIADAMRPEYQAIVNAGITLQLDCPDFAMSHNSVFQDLSIEEFRREIATGVEALNSGVAGLPSEKMRFHLCWGNYESPHTTDVPLGDIVDLITKAAPAGIVLEASNPRHGHEWKIFEDFKLPDDKYLVPGVIDTTTNFVEHPELVAQRLGAYASVVGSERVMAGTDCGFGSFIGRDRVAKSVVWSKLAALVEGTRIANARY
ncbi:MAG TPA: cobalamin-independent methionine synthase II family protein [Acidimicrobiales bacterium]|nr:cobalamin-independent methionine synthase II family protein [Acidimicrobiales bacterium]